MSKQILFIHGSGGESAYAEDGLLVASLRNALGAAYQVFYPKMPLEESAGYADWKAKIATELSALDDGVILVGHSVGGSTLLKYLAEEQDEKQIAGLFLLAAPYFGADKDWDYSEMNVKQGFGKSFSAIPQIFLYHSRDDETVPFAHLARYAAQLPQATIRVYEKRGHQFGNDLADVAKDIRSITNQDVP